MQTPHGCVLWRLEDAPTSFQGIARGLVEDRIAWVAIIPEKFRHEHIPWLNSIDRWDQPIIIDLPNGAFVAIGRD